MRYCISNEHGLKVLADDISLPDAKRCVLDFMNTVLRQTAIAHPSPPRTIQNAGYPKGGKAHQNFRERAPHPSQSGRGSGR